MVTVLYELGEACNEQLDSFWPLFPQEVDSAAPNVTMVDVQASTPLQLLKTCPSLVFMS